MKRNTVDCDRCKAKDLALSNLNSIHIDTDRRMDAAGSMETVTSTVDLCNSCMVDIARQLIMEKIKTHSSYEASADLVKWLKKGK